MVIPKFQNVAEAQEFFFKESNQPESNREVWNLAWQCAVDDALATLLDFACATSGCMFNPLRNPFDIAHDNLKFYLQNNETKYTTDPAARGMRIHS